MRPLFVEVEAVRKSPGVQPSSPGVQPSSSASMHGELGPGRSTMTSQSKIPTQVPRCHPPNMPELYQDLAAKELKYTYKYCRLSVEFNSNVLTLFYYRFTKL